MPYVLMIIVVFIYAGNIIVGKAINELYPFTITFFRLLVAFLFLLPLGYRGALDARHTFITYKRPFFMMALTGIALFNTFLYGALQFTSATNVSVLESAIPVVTLLLSAWLLKERLLLIQRLGIILSFIGSVTVIINGKFLQLAEIPWNVGDLIMFGAIISWAIYSVYVKQYMHLFPTFGAPLVMTGVSLVIVIPFLLIEWYMFGIPKLFTMKYVLGLLYLGVFPSFIALILYNRAVDMLSASEASVFLNFLPVVTIAAAYMWLGETITLMQLIGSVVVITGVLFTNYTRSNDRNKNVSSQKISRKLS